VKIFGLDESSHRRNRRDHRGDYTIATEGILGDPTLKILFCSHVFHPGIGGIETVSMLLATEFARAGAEVTVVTETPGEYGYPFTVVRGPTVFKLLELGRSSDLIFQNNISLKTLLPLFLSFKPIFVAHHTWLTRSGGKTGWQDVAKRIALRLCHNVAPSRALANHLPVPAEVIGNPFEAETFLQYREIPKDKDIVFVGRLVSDKGCDLAIEALAQMKEMGLESSLTVIGDGPDRTRLETLAFTLGVGKQVTFAGYLGVQRASVVARHTVLVVPSRWAEPFGLVALEGIAAGCAIVATSGGGLGEAVGTCGILVPNGNVTLLASALYQLLRDTEERTAMVARGPSHLAMHSPEFVASRYLQMFHEVTHVAIDKKTVTNQSAC
jgi:glycogen synthase